MPVLTVKVKGRNGASYDSETIKLLHARITSLLLGTDDAHKIVSVVIEHRHIGPKQGWVDNIQPFDDPAIRVDATAEVLVRTIRGAFQLHLLDMLKAFPDLRRQLGQLPSCRG